MLIMTLAEFRDLLLSADPEASHYTSGKTTNCTVWAEYDTNDVIADDGHYHTIYKIQVDRYTKIEFDPMVDAINLILEHPQIAYGYRSLYEKETGYIHHVWDCEVA